jgi:hypothetical protein
VGRTARLMWPASAMRNRGTSRSGLAPGALAAAAPRREIELDLSARVRHLD